MAQFVLPFKVNSPGRVINIDTACKAAELGTTAQLHN